MQNIFIYFYFCFYSVVILAEDEYIQDRLSDFGIEVQTTAEVEPIKVYPARILSHIYSLLGELFLKIMLAISNSDYI